MTHFRVYPIGFKNHKKKITKTAISQKLLDIFQKIKKLLFSYMLGHHLVLDTGVFDHFKKIIVVPNQSAGSYMWKCLVSAVQLYYLVRQSPLFVL